MDIEFQTHTEIKSFQEAKLKTALRYLQKHSPFYQRMFHENNIDIEQINYLEDLQKLPFTTKKDLQLHNDEFLCVPKSCIIDFITTSGTLGDPVIFAMTNNDLDRLAYNEKMSFSCAGVQPCDRVQLMTTIDKRFMGGLAYFLGLRMLGAGIVRVGNGIPELQWDSICRMQPSTIVCVPSFILHIIKYAKEHGIDYRSSSIKKLICIGENIREQDFTLNLLGQRIKAEWDIALHSTYAATEMAASFTECQYGCGGHHHPELIICEVIDENGSIVPEGSVGELAVTTLGVEGMPLLRFRMGDLVRLHTQKCRCGRTSMRLSPVVGRIGHLLKYKGTTFYPPAVYDVLDNTEYVENYVVEVHYDDCRNDHVVVRVGIRQGKGMQEHVLVKELKDRFRATIRVAPEIEICQADIIHTMNFPEKSRKPIKFIDKRVVNP
jgi:phenylacetate-CoA ligase